MRPKLMPAQATHQARCSEHSSISVRSTSQAELALIWSDEFASPVSSALPVRLGNAAAFPGIRPAFMVVSSLVPRKLARWVPLWGLGQVVRDLACSGEHLVLALSIARSFDALFAV